MIRFSKVEIVCAPSLLAAPAFAVRSVRAPCGGVRFARTGSRRFGRLDWAGYYLLGGRWDRG